LGRFLVKRFWHWFYAELPAYYSIPIIALAVAVVWRLVND